MMELSPGSFLLKTALSTFKILSLIDSGQHTHTHTHIYIYISKLTAILSTGLRICWLYSQETKKVCPGYYTQLHLIVRLHFWSPGECEVPLYYNYSLDSICWDPTNGSNRLVWKLFDWNTWCHLAVSYFGSNFFVSWHINLRGLFNTKATLYHSQIWLCVKWT